MKFVFPYVVLKVFGAREVKKCNYRKLTTYPLGFHRLKCYHPNCLLFSNMGMHPHLFSYPNQSLFLFPRVDGVILGHLIGLQIQFMLFEVPVYHYKLYSEQWLVGLLRLQ